MKFEINKSNNMKKFNVEELHQQAAKRIEERKRSKNVLGNEFDINVNESYKRSLAMIEGNDELSKDEKDEQITHLESVLSAGACKL